MKREERKGLISARKVEKGLSLPTGSYLGKGF
jgi:hypothetical protein